MFESILGMSFQIPATVSLACAATLAYLLGRFRSVDNLEESTASS